MENRITFSEDTLADIEEEINSDFSEMKDIRSALEAFCRRHSTYDEYGEWKDGILMVELTDCKYHVADLSHDSGIPVIRIKLTSTGELNFKLLSDFQYEMDSIRYELRDCFNSLRPNVDENSSAWKKLWRILFYPIFFGGSFYGIGLCFYASYAYCGGFHWGGMLLSMLASIPIGFLGLFLLNPVSFPVYGVTAFALRYVFVSSFDGDPSFLTTVSLLAAIPLYLAILFLFCMILMKVFEDSGIMIVYAADTSPQNSENVGAGKGHGFLAAIRELL